MNNDVRKKMATYVQALNSVSGIYRFNAEYDLEKNSLKAGRQFRHTLISTLTPFGGINDLVHLNSDTNAMKSLLQYNNENDNAAELGKRFDLDPMYIKQINAEYIRRINETQSRWKESDYIHIFVTSLLDLAVLGITDHFFQISKKIKKKLSSFVARYERRNFLRRRYQPLQETVDSIEEITYLSKEELQTKRQSERAYQAELKKNATDSLYTEGEIPQGGGAANPIKQRRSHGRYNKQSRPNDLTVGGGGIELSKITNDLSKKIVWRKDKTCKLYSTPTILAEKVKARFLRNSGAVKYRDCVDFLEQEGWYFVEQGKHPKLAHVDFPEILDKTNEKQYYAQFYNYHPGSDDRYDLLRWAEYNGKKYGPSQ